MVICTYINLIHTRKSLTQCYIVSDSLAKTKQAMNGKEKEREMILVHCQLLTPLCDLNAEVNTRRSNNNTESLNLF